MTSDATAGSPLREGTEALTLAHTDHALRFVDLLADVASPPQSVELYLNRLEVPAARARAVYQRGLAHLAGTLLPRLSEDRRRSRSG